jgi:hypothetical protein
MHFKNANLGAALGLTTYIVCSLLMGREPRGVEVIAITALTFGSAFGLLYFLNWRDRRLGRPLPPSLFRRSGSDGEGPG